jgi:hypothetical protein
MSDCYFLKRATHQGVSLGIWGCNQKFPDWVDNEIIITIITIMIINTRWEATQRVMAANLTRLTHKIAIHLHLVAESCTISCSRRPVWKLLDIPSYRWGKSVRVFSCKHVIFAALSPVVGRIGYLTHCSVVTGITYRVRQKHITVF